MIYDALEMTYRTVRVQKDPDCAVCAARTRRSPRE